MRFYPLNGPGDVARLSAGLIVARINAFKPTKDRPFKLGLPTGSTPIKTYEILIDLYKKGHVSFEHVVTFNMDEYVGLPRNHDQSYWRFMHENFFNHVNISPENINILDGMTDDFAKECQRFEDKIKEVGGIDFFLGGIGHDGHIAFNEPFSSLHSRTRLKYLTQETIAANARFFDGDLSKVPKSSLTIGVGTFMEAHEICIMATGSGKALAVQQAVEGQLNHQWTCTTIQIHPKAHLMVDEPATNELKWKTLKYFRDIEHPILTKAIECDDPMEYSFDSYVH